MELLSPDVIKQLNKIKTRKNVVAFSNVLLPRMKDGKKLEGELCIRVYVWQKQPSVLLSKKQLIPRTIKTGGATYKTDVVIWQPRLFVDKTKRIRPVPAGVSVGIWTVTAGSLAIRAFRNGNTRRITNAHVLTQDPSLSIKEIQERRVLQPGKAHGGQLEANINGRYTYHKQLHPDNVPSTCDFPSPQITAFLNGLAKLARRNTRWKIVQEPAEVNHLDLAAYEELVPHIDDFADGSIDVTKQPFSGLLFAGDPSMAALCKVKWMMEEGFTFPYDTYEPEYGDELIGSSFWCNFKTNVEDPSATVQVMYPNNKLITQTDLTLIKNDGTIKPGWSGSAFFRVI